MHTSLNAQACIQYTPALSISISSPFSHDRTFDPTMDESPRTARRAPGGFLPPRDSLPSPTPSTASSRAAALLPHPRSRPLVPGSRKEDYARDYVARRLLHISRRYVKKFAIPDPADEVTGYESMEEVCRDLGEVVDVLWFSGTRMLNTLLFLLSSPLPLLVFLSSCSSRVPASD